MTKRQRQARRVASSRRPLPRWLGAALLLGVAAMVIVMGLPGRDGGNVAWSTLRTQDVHSLAFVGGDAQHLLFGHHGGILETRDGGRIWAQLPVEDDAMSLTRADDGSIVIAGHLVFRTSRDGGQTWTNIATNLPNLDIHGFTRDPADPARMWAYLATGGLWASGDSGANWTQVRTDNVIFPFAVRDGTATRLLGVDATGLVASLDGGTTWTTIGSPPTYPMTALAATPDGRTVYAGAHDGLFRSDDGGRTWLATGYRGSAFAIATTPDGQTVALVDKDTAFFRSANQGWTWPGP